MIMKRKTFIRKTTAGLIFGIPAIALLGCSSSDDGDGGGNPNPQPSANCLEKGTNSTVGASQGHTHNLSVSKEDVSAGVAKTYTLSESASHIHQVTISEAQFDTLKANNSISAVSTSDSGHSHSVSVSCA
jgi:hypothetical protein